MKDKELPEEEKNFQKNYVKAPSFLSIHMGVKASVLPAGTDCHHFVLEVCIIMFSDAVHAISLEFGTLVAFFLYQRHESILIGCVIGRMIGITWRSLMEAYF